MDRSGLVGIDPSHRDQRQAYVAHLLKQPMKSGLVDDKTMDEGGAVALVGEAESVEPSGPSRSEVSFETDLVPSNLAPLAS